MKLNIDKCIPSVFFTFIFIKAFYGPLGLISPMVNYLGAALMLIFLLLKWGKSLLVRRDLVLVTLLLCIYIMIGVLKNGAFQAVFGIYVIIPFLFSIAYSDILSKKIFYNSYKIFLFLGVSCYLGVLFVNFYGAPWLGAKLNVAGYEKVLSRDWTTGGVLRNPGFTIASFDAATLLMICSFFISYYFREKKRWISSVIVLVIFIYPIYLTTTKTTMVIYFIMLTLYVMPGIVTVASSRMFLVGMVFFTYIYMIPSATHVKFDSSNSLEIRMYQTWPNAINYLQDGISVMFGNGIGSIGMPSTFSSLGRYNPADNMLVYFFVISGLVSLFAVALLLFRFVTFRITKMNERKKYYLFAFCIFSGGLTYNLFESVFYAPFAGILIGMLFNRNVLASVDDDNLADTNLSIR